MSKRLTESDIESILGLLDGWQGKLSWSALCEGIENNLGFKTTRQTLNSYPSVKDAFQALKQGGLGSQKLDRQIKQAPSLTIASQRIERLTRENERLQRKNKALLEQFAIWQYNAHINQLTEEKLNKPLPQIDREIT